MPSTINSSAPLRLPLLYGMLIGINLIWGSSWVVLKLGYQEFSPLQLGGWRMVISGVLILPWLVFALRRERVARRDLPRIFWLAMIGFSFNKALLYLGVSLSTALNASLLMTMEPMLTLLIARMLLGEHLTGKKLAAVLIGCGGAWLLIARGVRTPDFSSAGVVGDLLFVLGLALEALFSVSGKKMVRRYSPALVTAMTIVFSSLFWGPVLLYDGLSNGWPSPSWKGISILFYLAIGTTIISYTIWLYTLRRLQAGIVGMSVLLQPLFGFALAVWLLEEIITPATLAGGALVIGALLMISMGELFNHSQTKKEKDPHAPTV